MFLGVLVCMFFSLVLGGVVAVGFFFFGEFKVAFWVFCGVG